MKICMQTAPLVKRFGVENAYRIIAEAGFTGIDWGLDLSWNFEKVFAAPTLSGLYIFEKPLPEILAHYETELAAIRKNGLAISQAHAPFRPFDFRRKELLDYAISIYKNMILFCDAVGCKRLVIHGISIRVEDTETTPELCRAYNEKLYGELIPVLRETDVMVCMENLFVRNHRSGPEDFYAAICHEPHEAIEWIDTMNARAGKRAFGLCFDTGHLHLLRGDAARYISLLGDRICALHLHDNEQLTDAHRIPYTGSFPWDRFLAALKAVGYKGDISFESLGGGFSKFPDPVKLAFLRATYEIGAYFRSYLNE